jgi:hypothetical protein
MPQADACGSRRDNGGTGQLFEESENARIRSGAPCSSRCYPKPVSTCVLCRRAAPSQSSSVPSWAVTPGRAGHYALPHTGASIAHNAWF